jgi:chromosome segregation ATPase
MNASDFFRPLWQRWQNLANHAWPATPREQTRSEIARLDRELPLLSARLIRIRRRINDLRERPDGTEKVARLEALYQKQRDRLDRRKRLRRELASGRLVVVGVTYPE